MKRENYIKSAQLKRKFSGLLLGIGAFAFACLLSLDAVSQGKTQGTPTEKGTMFPTAEAAAEAFVAAAEKFDEAAMMQILGPNSYDIIHSGEPIVDKEVAQEFATLARKQMSVMPDKRFRNRAFITIGDDKWLFPVPLVKQGKEWYFDTAAGRQEVLFRRIGRNELTAIDICRGYVEAQHEYALTKHDGAQVNQYAQRIISTPGKRDGLAWQNPDGTWGGPVGERAAAALEKSYTGKTGVPFHGYYFKVLKGQGPAAPLGQMNFLVKDVMIGGFALLAYPAIYQVTGVKTFMVSHDGVVYEKDLGSNTSQLADGIELFNPDRTWSPVFEGN